MKNTGKVLVIAAVIAAICFMILPLTGCDNGTTPISSPPPTDGTTPTDGTPPTGGDLDLPGTITISPSTGVTVDTELTAIYSRSETVSYQWEKKRR